MTNKELTASLDRLTGIIERMTQPIAPIPAIPAIPTNSGDHDLLTKLDTKVDQIQMDVTELKKQGTIYVTQPEHAELVKKVDDQSNIVTGLVAFKNTLMGKMWGVGILAGFGSGVLMMAIQYFINHK
jgi:hypothetical protein